MRKTEDRSRGQHAQPHVSKQSRELPLKISAKDDLFNKTRRCAHADPKNEFEYSLRSQQLDRLLPFINCTWTRHVHGIAQSDKNRISEDPKTKRDGNIEKEIIRRIPSSANYFAQLHTREAHSQIRQP